MIGPGTTSGDGEVVEAVHLGNRNLGSDEDAVGAVGASQAAGDLVQLVQARPLRVGNEQLDLGQRLLEGGLDPAAQPVEALSGPGRDEDGLRMAQERVPAALLVQ